MTKEPSTTMASLDLIFVYSLIEETFFSVFGYLSNTLGIFRYFFFLSNFIF